MITTTVTTVFTIVFLGFLMMVLPTLSRPSIFFGVTIDPVFRDTKEGRRVLKSFRTIVLAVTAAAIALKIAVLDGASVVVVLIGILLAWLHANKTVRARAQVESPSLRSASLTPGGYFLPGGWLFLAGPVLIPVAAVAFLAFHWDSIPDPFPVSWNAAGVPYRFVPRTFPRPYAPLILGLLMNLVILVIAYQIALRTRRVSATGSAAEREMEFRRFGYLLVVCLAYVAAFIVSANATRVLWTEDLQRLGLLAWVFPALPLLVVIPGLLTFLRKGQGFSRAPGGLPSTIGDGTRDDRWLLGGLLYYNPDDSALLVEKRLGFGWTLNFGNRLSWLLIGALLSTPLVMVFLSR